MADNYASYDEEDLVSEDPDQRNWKGIGIALLVIATVCSLIITAIVLLTPEDLGPRIRHPLMELDDVMDGVFVPRLFNGTWISDHEFLFRDSDGAATIYNAETLRRTVVMPNTTFRQMNVHQYSISPDRKYMLLAIDYKKMYRHSFLAKYRIFNISNEHVVPLLHDDSNAMLQFAQWGRGGSQLVFVRDSNMFYMPQFSALTKPRPLTTNGENDVILNGVPDWVYEEEILQSNNAIWWSDDGTKIAYACFNDSAVDFINLPKYGDYHDVTNLYPQFRRFRYPKAGRNNPTVKLWVIDLTRMDYAKTEIVPPDDYKEKEFYFTSLQWVSHNRIAVTWLKRFQNSSLVSICDAAGLTYFCDNNLPRESHGRGWIDMQDKPVFGEDKRFYFIRLPLADGKAGYFRHVAMINTSVSTTNEDLKRDLQNLNGRKTFLTHGQFDVTKILAHHKDTNKVYYLTTLPNSPSQRHLFSVTDMNSDMPRTEECLTCDLGDDCKYHNAIFSPGAKYYILECLGPGVPWIDLRATDNNTRLDLLDSNDNVRCKIESTAMPQLRTFNVPIEGGYNANVRLLLPPGLRDEEMVKYPMVINVYGGPGSQMVTDKFSVHWGSYLASRKNFVYSWIDGRGSGNQGDKRLHEIYRKLGSTEIEDQLNVASYLKNEIPFIDRYRTAIWGWSYGGYSTIMALATDSQVFNCGIAVAPVTSWLYYDSVYSERYMQMPWATDNYIGYEKADVTKKAANIKDKKLLLIHGTADDNVHTQQSLMLMKAITDAGVMYHAQVYPDESHSLSNVKSHLYRTMESFLDNCFGIPEGEERLPPQTEEKKR
ncbi:inactive dipeptidyl peptidase 10-like isoform X1 [Argiope bruennichi]|uniref:inactive dipeptidyl peptidase 10-like isoform X1 n=2 Tax=Argiope bruennichi TaxID=94029 RepID=UPI002495411E|nr:inactive dipeptidyl peptidase 10-like isoform X1 [Argiope bruennichi]